MFQVRVKCGPVFNFYRIFFFKEKTSLKSPHCHLHAVNAKMKGGIKAKFTVNGFCELSGAVLRIWAFISVCEISVHF